MISIMLGRVENGIDLSFQIERWEVWFRLPTGLVATMEEARKWCNEHDMEVDLVAIPTAVAIGPDRRYEACRS